ncbi:MAG TPA: hypothetical protein VFD46_04645 [Chryseolinea sp.]|nr:hypothetical protein [Chryseolinea sp.]
MAPFDGDANNLWSYDAPWLELNFSNGSHEKVFVERGRDWENKKACLIFTGLNEKRHSRMGEKITLL